MSLSNEEVSRLVETSSLSYVSDETPGIRRKRWGRGFTYFDSQGNRITCSRLKERIKSLVIPPAWEEVWICPTGKGHIQATGRDDQGRKQYIYHEEWCRLRDQVKFSRMASFGKRLPEIRKQTEDDLRRRGLPKRKVLAAVVQLLDASYFRIGNLEYVKRNNSFGLSTLRDRHVDISGSAIQFEFRGKRGKIQNSTIQDRRLARVVRSCQEIPGQTLFQYYDDEKQRCCIDSGEVNDYIQEISGDSFTAKDFRTWGGTLLAIIELLEMGDYSSQTEAKKNLVQAVKSVADELGNEPAACRKYYIHPQILTSYSDGKLLPRIKKILKRLERKKELSLNGLQLEELVLLEYLKSLDHSILDRLN